ncbi:MAG: hypothetical protein ACRCSG_03990 [Cellulosilyticaceae bacterium]
MQQYECGHCGYDMSGIEKFSNSLDMMLIENFDGIMPISTQGLYNMTTNNTVKCPKCGKSGYWLNSI